MKALMISCTLKPSPALSNTEALAAFVADELRDGGVEVELNRLVDLHISPGVETEMGEGDQWPEVHRALLEADILVVLTPTWVGRPSSVAQKMLERMDAMMLELKGGLPVAYGKVAGVVCTGNEDGAHHVITEICGGLLDLGYTIPPQPWTYWNKGPGPGEDFLETDYRHGWSKKTGRQAARNLVAVAEALKIAKFQYEQ